MFQICVLAIHTAAIEMLSGPDAASTSRKPEIMGDAVYALICKDSRSITGKFLVDEDILREEGITDFTQYACDPGNFFTFVILKFFYLLEYIFAFVVLTISDPIFSKCQQFDDGLFPGRCP